MAIIKLQLFPFYGIHYNAFTLASCLAGKIAGMFLESPHECTKDNVTFVSLLLKAVRSLKYFFVSLNVKMYFTSPHKNIGHTQALYQHI